MIAFWTAHSTAILSTLLTLSEAMALLFPSAGGFLKAAISGLKALGAKDVDGQ